jgi:hypothetical protein
MRKVLYAVFAASAAIGIMLPAAASAATTPIRNVTSGCSHTSHCGGQNLLAPELALSVDSDSAGKGSPVEVRKPAANKKQDFLISGPATDVTIEWAPNGATSGLCISEPSTSINTGLVLRKCNGSDYQTWAPGDFIMHESFNAWVNKASGFAMTDPNSGPSGTQLVSGKAGTASNEEWEAIA